MTSIQSNDTNLSRLGHINADIQCLVAGLHWAEVRTMKWDANEAAHSLARYARNISDVVYWLEDTPPPALEALSYDSI